MVISDEVALEAAKILRDYCTDRGCKDCPISCRWDEKKKRIPTQIPAYWRLNENIKTE